MKKYVLTKKDAVQTEKELIQDMKDAILSGQDWEVENFQYELYERCPEIYAHTSWIPKTPLAVEYILKKTLVQKHTIELKELRAQLQLTQTN